MGQMVSSSHSLYEKQLFRHLLNSNEEQAPTKYSKDKKHCVFSYLLFLLLSKSYIHLDQCPVYSLTSSIWRPIHFQWYSRTLPGHATVKTEFLGKTEWALIMIKVVLSSLVSLFLKLKVKAQSDRDFEIIISALGGLCPLQYFIATR